MSASSAQDSSGGAPVREGDILASKYRVEKVLGIGGMGVVVAATHVDLDQRVALKFLLPAASSNEELVGRFMREARASVRLKGRHVVKVLDVGRLEDDAPYIVMEFLEGSDLAAVMKTRPPGTTPIEEVVTYMLHTCEGLAEAHSYGIIHRDLKPGNLFLTRGVDGKPLVKVLDFGISKTIDRSITGEAASLTKTEMLLGSPLYMSPEQMRSSKHVDERADIWALGALMYEMLTGTVPFIADTIMGLCFAVAQEQPKDPREMRPDIPEELAKAILHCLEKDPAKRFSNVAELASAIEPFGPQRTRGTGERALDVLSTGKRKPMRSISPDDQPVVPSNPTTDPTLAAASLGASPMARSDLTPAPNAVPNPHVAGYPFGSTSDPAMQTAPAPGVSQGDVAAQAAWGGTRSEPMPKAPAPSKRGWILPVAAGAVVIGALGGVAFFKGMGTPPASNNLSSSSTPAPPSAATTMPSSNPVAAGGTGASTSAAAPVESMQNAGVAPAVSTAPSATTPAVPGKATPGRPNGTGSVPGKGTGTKPAGSAPAAASVAPAPTGATPTAAPAGSGFLRVRE